MTKGIYGSPRLRGNSEVIVGGVFEKPADTGDAATQLAALVGGKAVSRVASTKGDQNIVVDKFNGTNFAGFAVANDLGKKTFTVSVVKEGLNIPVPLATGKVVTLESQLGINAAGDIIDATDSDCVFILNAELAENGVTACDADGVEHAGQVAINLSQGGAVKTP